MMDNGKDPPDKDNLENMELQQSSQSPNIVQVAEGHLSIDLAGNSADSDDDVEPPKKRRSSCLKRVSRSSSLSRSQAGSSPTASELNSLIDENLLPKLDTSLHCPKCDEKAPIHEAILCCSCNSYFHAIHGDKAAVGGKMVMPAKTYVNHWIKSIANHDGGAYVAGRFSFTCASCINLKVSSDNKSLPDRLNSLESIVLKGTLARDAQIQALTDSLTLLQQQIALLLQSSPANEIHQPSSTPTLASATTTSTDSEYISAPPPAVTPIQKRYSDILSEPSPIINTRLPGSTETDRAGASLAATTSSQKLPAQSQTTTAQSPSTNSSDSNNQRSRRNNAKFSLRVSKNDEDGIAMTKVLERLAIDKKIDTYDFRSRGKFAVDLFFPNSKEACDAHSCLVDSVDQEHVVVGSPEMVSPKRCYFVNLPDKFQAKDLMSTLDERFPELSLGDSNKNKFCIKIFEPRRCFRDKTKIRSTVLLSDDLYEYFMYKLNGRVSLGNYTMLDVYDCIQRCIKCQSFEHTVESCRKKVSVCGYCGKDHHTHKCPVKNDVLKHHCVNCFSDPLFKDKCSGHGANSPDCPYYLHCIKIRDKY